MLRYNLPFESHSRVDSWYHVQPTLVVRDGLLDETTYRSQFGAPSARLSSPRSRRLYHNDDAAGLLAEQQLQREEEDRARRLAMAQPFPDRSTLQPSSTSMSHYLTSSQMHFPPPPSSSSLLMQSPRQRRDARHRLASPATAAVPEYRSSHIRSVRHSDPTAYVSLAHQSAEDTFRFWDSPHSALRHSSSRIWHHSMESLDSRRVGRVPAKAAWGAAPSAARMAFPRYPSHMY